MIAPGSRWLPAVTTWQRLCYRPVAKNRIKRLGTSFGVTSAGRMRVENPRESDWSWRKSSLSMNSDCVEVRLNAGVISIRHSDAPDGPQLVFSRAQWKAFVEGVRLGEFDV
jgi:hypothetical protein